MAIEVCFSPNNGCMALICAAIKQRAGKNTNIYIQAYGFTHPDLMDALKQAVNNGTVVRVLLDKRATQEKKQFECAKDCQQAGMTVMLDGKHPIAHNKVILIEALGKYLLITGSYNFSEQAEHNGENLLFISHELGLQGSYWNNWHDHKSHCETFNPRILTLICETCRKEYSYGVESCPWCGGESISLANAPKLGSVRAGQIAARVPFDTREEGYRGGPMGMDAMNSAPEVATKAVLETQKTDQRIGVEETRQRANLSELPGVWLNLLAELQDNEKYPDDALTFGDALKLVQAFIQAEPRPCLD